MAFFQKKPVVSSSAPAYTIGATKTVLIIGLGNPGAEHEGSRHNIGFAVLEDFAKTNDFPGWTVKTDLKTAIAVKTLSEARVILAKPQTYMNNSGQAVAALQHFYKVDNSQTLVVYDELAVDFGSLRTRVGGSDAGHNGVKSLIQHIDDDFLRLRVGIGSEQASKVDNSDFVLAKFSKKEEASLPRIVREAGALITEYVFSGSLPDDTRKAI